MATPTRRIPQGKKTIKKIPDTAITRWYPSSPSHVDTAITDPLKGREREREKKINIWKVIIWLWPVVG